MPISIRYSLNTSLLLLRIDACECVRAQRRLSACVWVRETCDNRIEYVLLLSSLHSFAFSLFNFSQALSCLSGSGSQNHSVSMCVHVVSEKKLNHKKHSCGVIRWMQTEWYACVSMFSCGFPTIFTHIKSTAFVYVCSFSRIFFFRYTITTTLQCTRIVVTVAVAVAAAAAVRETYERVMK